ncbi:hypothetical protein Ancab_033860 [Ancistrocladus abbreviatus]
MVHLRSLFVCPDTNADRFNKSSEFRPDVFKSLRVHKLSCRNCFEPLLGVASCMWGMSSLGIYVQ